MARKKAGGKVLSKQRKKSTAKAAGKKLAKKKGKRVIHGRMGRPKDI